MYLSVSRPVVKSTKGPVVSVRVPPDSVWRRRITEDDVVAERATADQAADDDDGSGVAGAERRVEEEDFGIHGEGTGEADALLPTAGELAAAGELGGAAALPPRPQAPDTHARSGMDHADGRIP